jgi:hypothetical protein
MIEAVTEKRKTKSWKLQEKNKNNKFNKCNYPMSWAMSQGGCDCCAYTLNQMHFHKYGKKIKIKEKKKIHLALEVR